jgi:hypothetical protein
MSQGEQVSKLLQQLNELEQRYGRAVTERDPDYAASGEVNALVQVLTQELLELGATLHWNGRQHHLADLTSVVLRLDDYTLAGKAAATLAPVLGHALCEGGDDALAEVGDDSGMADRVGESSGFVLRMPDGGGVQMRLAGRVSRDGFLRVLRADPESEAGGAAIVELTVLPRGDAPGDAR